MSQPPLVILPTFMQARAALLICWYFFRNVTSGTPGMDPSVARLGNAGVALITKPQKTLLLIAGVWKFRFQKFFRAKFPALTYIVL
jgi:hypothetical protein